MMASVKRAPTMRKLIALLPPALLLLGGCFSGLDRRTPPPQVYLLRPTLITDGAGPAPASAPASAQPLPGGVRVPVPQALAGLGTDGIAVLRSGQRLDYFRGVRWAGTAPEMLQTLALDALRATRRYAWVETDRAPFPAEYLLSLELRDFEAEYADAGPPTVHVAIDGIFGRRGDRRVILSFTAESRVTAEADRMQAVIAAFQRATGDVLRQLTDRLASAGAAAP